LTITDSTFSNNSAVSMAGGIFFSPNSATATANITNTTISGNTSGYGTGVTTEDSTAILNLVNSTITNNTATGSVGGGVVKGHGASTLRADNTIIAQNTAFNTAYHDVAGALASGSSYNVLGQAGSSGLLHGVADNKVGVDAKLAPLGDYGGKTKTHALKLTSPALESGSDSLAPSHDQRGEERPVAGAGVSDIGAFEAGDLTVLTVRTDVDRLNSVLNPDELSLREALALADSLSHGETIVFDDSLFEAGPATINLAYDGPDGGTWADALWIEDATNIVGPGASLLTVYGAGLTVFNTSGTVTIDGVTITNGGGLNGGGILAQGDLTIRRSRIVGNNVSGDGGGINADLANLRIIDSEISDNTTTGLNGRGAGIFSSREGGGYLEVINSTISGNQATGANSFGGGLFIEMWEGSNTWIINSTITDNSAANGGGIYSTEIFDTQPAFVLLHNTIVADNIAGGDIAGENLNSDSSHNLLRSGSSGGLSSTQGNILLSGSNTARLKPLDFYGGQTRSHLLYSNSEAIDAGDDAIATYWGLSDDQRGLERIIGDDIDIGAVERAFVELVEFV
jgi:predicted outer membrane repeat protein